MNNLTNLNLTLKLFGPMSESNLTIVLLIEQVFCSFIALGTGFTINELVRLTMMNHFVRLLPLDRKSCEKAIRYQLSELLYSK